MWNAARRLACFVASGLVLVVALRVRDALLHRAAGVADFSAALAAYLVVGALVSMIRARRFFARIQDPPPTRDEPYRSDTGLLPADRDETERARATRCAAGALIALAFAGAFVVVAAAAR